MSALEPTTREGHGPAVAESSSSEGRLERAEGSVAAGRPGPFLYEGSREDAAELGHLLATRLGTIATVRPADVLGLTGHPVEETTAALRDAVHLRVRVLKKVFEGRLEGVRRIGPNPGALGTRTPPAVVEVDLSTDSDRRTVRLEGGFSTALWQSGARPGDIIQIDTDQPLVVVRPDREEAEGFVAEERDLVYRVTLGDVDRTGVPARPEAEEGRRLPPNAPLRRPVLGTGRLPAPGLEAMRTTDRWAEEQLGGKGTRLEPGVLVLTGAEALVPLALVVLREAVQAPAAPVVLLASEDHEAVRHWQRFFPSAERLD